MAEQSLDDIRRNARLVVSTPYSDSSSKKNIGFEYLTLPEKICVQDIALGIRKAPISVQDPFQEPIRAANEMIRLGRVSTTLAPFLERARKIGSYDLRVEWAGENGYAQLIIH